MFPKDGSWKLIVSHRAEDAIWGYVDPGKKPMFILKCRETGLI